MNTKRKIPTREPDIKIDGYLAIWTVNDAEGYFSYHIARVKLKNGEELVYSGVHSMDTLIRVTNDAVAAELLDMYATRI